MRYLIAIVITCCAAFTVTSQTRTFENVTIEHVLNGIVSMDRIDTTRDGNLIVRGDTFDVAWRTSGERIVQMGIRVRYGMDSVLRTSIPDRVYIMLARIYGFRSGTMPMTVVQRWNDHLAWLIQENRIGTVGVGRGYPDVVIHMGPESYQLSIH